MKWTIDQRGDAFEGGAYRMDGLDWLGSRGGLAPLAAHRLVDGTSPRSGRGRKRASRWTDMIACPLSLFPADGMAYIRPRLPLASWSLTEADLATKRKLIFRYDSFVRPSLP